MMKKRYTDEQIACALSQAEAGTDQGGGVGSSGYRKRFSRSHSSASSTRTVKFVGTLICQGEP